MIKLIISIIFLINAVPLDAMKQKMDLFYRKKIQKTKTTTPSYCPCINHHYMIYNSCEIIHLLYVFHLPKTKESKESIKSGQLIDKHVAKQAIMNANYKKRLRLSLKRFVSRFASNNYRITRNLRFYYFVYIFKMKKKCYTPLYGKTF